MSKLFDEVRKIASEKMAEKQKSSEQNYPKLIEKIKRAAERGDTSCIFEEYEIDQYSRKLLEVDGFRVWITTRIPDRNDYLAQRKKSESIWEVSW